MVRGPTTPRKVLIMNTRRILTCTPLVAALLSAVVLIQPAHAGLLGGGGSLGGGLGGGLNIGNGSRSLDVGGAAAGSASREATTLPRPDKKAVEAAGGAAAKAGDKAESSKQQGSATGQAAASAGLDKAADSKGLARNVAGNVTVCCVPA